MRFISRAISGLLLSLTTLALIAFGAWKIHAALTLKPDSTRPGVQERSFTVETGVLTPRSIKPVLTAFGQIKAWTMLDLRAASTGPITTLAPNFRDGRLVEQDEVLFTIDPEVAERRVVDARAALAQAQSTLAEAKASVAHLKSELASAEAQLLVQKRDFERKQLLLSKKVSTEAVVDQSLLVMKAGEQMVIAKQNGLTAGLAKIEQADAGVKRAELTLKDAQRALKDSTLRAPFSGRITDVNVTLGRRVAQNEKIGALIDPRSLEVAFSVRNEDYARLVNPANPSQLLKLPVRVLLSMGSRVAVVEGRLDRSSAVVAATQAGRMLFARLIDAERSPLRPGDFVTIEIVEPEIEDVAIVPALAATAEGEILVVGVGSRLEAVKSRVLRFQGEDLIVDQVPFGARYVRMRLPFLAPGVLVKLQDKIDAAKPQTRASGTRIVKLSDVRRNRLIELVRDMDGLNQDDRNDILEMLARNEVTEQILERLEGQRAEGAERRQRL